MATRSSRVLIKPYVLDESVILKGLQVPVKAIMRGFKITITQPTFTRLLMYWNKSMINHSGNNSLHPEWLDNSKDAPVEQYAPLGWEYKGEFPFGSWEYTHVPDEEC